MEKLEEMVSIDRSHGESNVRIECKGPGDDFYSVYLLESTVETGFDFQVMGMWKSMRIE